MSTTPQQESAGDLASPGKQRPIAAGTGAMDRLTVVAAELSGKWQIPLFVTALAFLGVSVWRLRPQPKPPSFDSLLAKAITLQEASLYEDASNYAESLLADPARTPDERARLHRLIAEVIFAHESGNSVHGPNNCRGILEHSDGHCWSMSSSPPRPTGSGR